MPKYTAPVSDFRFILSEVLEIETFGDLPGFEDINTALINAILDEAGKFTSEVIAPLNQVGDKEGCTYHTDGSVVTPPGFKEAYDKYCEAGWGTLNQPKEFGGQGLPNVLAFALKEMMSSANQAFGMYPGLTNGAIEAIKAKGDQFQKELYLQKMVSGQWSGTMNLTEAHCGTDLGMIRSCAVPQPDGSFRLTGTKIFISAGEHDLSENIIHLVLAKTPGAPAGSKGISLFIVPKFLINEDGSLGSRNKVFCGSIERKMGIHGNATCVLNYDDAIGWMVGEENKGLAAMFIMMNDARLGTGMQGYAQAEVAYQNAVSYAKDRRQGRALTGPFDPGADADPIIVHADVRRMLMDAKVFTEGARTLCLWAALKSDLAEKALDESERSKAHDFLSLITPVIKGYTTDKGYEVATNMQQVFGGHGYIEEWGMSQFVRDARIAQIYEGANGIQAMDLCGRKLGQKGGETIQSFFSLIANEIEKAKETEELTTIAAKLEESLEDQKLATAWFMRNAYTDPTNLGAGAHHYMHLMGVVTLGFMWLKMAKVAHDKLSNEKGDKSFYKAKLVSARYYSERFLPDTASLRKKIEAGSAAMMALDPEAFTTST